MNYLHVFQCCTEITAANAQAVISVKTRIEILVDSIRPQLPWTHFVSIPLNTDNFIRQFELFKSLVMEHASTTNVSNLKLHTSHVRMSLKPRSSYKLLHMLDI